MTQLWRRYRANYAYLYRLTRADVWTGALLLPGSRAYRVCVNLTRAGAL